MKRTFSYEAAAGLIRGGWKYHEIAAIFGVSRDAIQYVARKLGVHPPRISSRSCISCGRPALFGHGRSCKRCESCDRRHYRNGSCSCGAVWRRQKATCVRCGAPSPLPLASPVPPWWLAGPKLPPEKRAAILAELVRGTKVMDAAKKFGVSYGTAWRIGAPHRDWIGYPNGGSRPRTRRPVEAA